MSPIMNLFGKMMLWFSTASCNGEFLNYLTSCVDPGQPTYVSVNNLKLSTTTWSCKDRYPFLFMQSLSLEGILFSLKCVPSMTPAIPDILRSSSNWSEISCCLWTSGHEISRIECCRVLCKRYEQSGIQWMLKFQIILIFLSS